MLRYLTAGESHGQCLTAILEGIPSGLPLRAEQIDHDLARRQKGYGRGGRMRIEQDRVDFLAGVRKGHTLGNPISLLIRNKDWENWKEIMSTEPGPPPTEKVVTVRLRGTAVLAVAINYTNRDTRNVWEKATAGKPAIRVAFGA